MTLHCFSEGFFLPGTKETFIYKPVVIRPAVRLLKLNTKLTNQSEPREAGLFEASQKDSPSISHVRILVFEVYGCDLDKILPLS